MTGPVDEGVKRHSVDREALPSLFPTNRHEPAFWEAHYGNTCKITETAASKGVIVSLEQILLARLPRWIT